MDENSNVVDIDMKGAPACGRCFMLVARYAPQVIASSGTYHRFQVREIEGLAA